MLLGNLSQSAFMLRRERETTESSSIALFVNNVNCFLRPLCVVILSACQLYTQTIHSSYQVYLLTEKHFCNALFSDAYQSIR